MKATLIINATGERIKVRSTTSHPASSYGKAVWVDDNNQAYCQVDMPSPLYTIEIENVNPFRSELGAMIRNARIMAGLTQRKLSVLSGVSEQNIRKIEGGRYNLSVDILNKIISPMGLSVILQLKKGNKMKASEVKTISDLCDYINEREEWPLEVEQIIEANGWVNDCGDDSGVCHNDRYRLIINEEGKAEVL